MIPIGIYAEKHTCTIKNNKVIPVDHDEIGREPESRKREILLDSS
jgi:hypothetical protein